MNEQYCESSTRVLKANSILSNSVSGAWNPGLGAGASRDLGPGPPGAWGPGLQDLGAWGSAALKLPVFWGPGLEGSAEKSPGGRQAKGWETAETAAAEVGAWREAGTYPPPPHLGKKRKEEGFSPSPLLKPSNTPPKVGGLRGAFEGGSGLRFPKIRGSFLGVSLIRIIVQYLRVYGNYQVLSQAVPFLNREPLNPKVQIPKPQPKAF